MTFLFDSSDFKIVRYGLFLRNILVSLILLFEVSCSLFVLEFSALKFVIVFTMSVLIFNCVFVSTFVIPASRLAMIPDVGMSNCLFYVLDYNRDPNLESLALFRG